jgi:hypothetical protein
VNTPASAPGGRDDQSQQKEQQPDIDKADIIGERRERRAEQGYACGATG